LYVFLSVLSEASHGIHTVTGPKWRRRDWLRRGMQKCALECFKLMHCAQFEPLWDYLNVRTARHSLFFLTLVIAVDTNVRRF
jgi:hypothetical protein